MIRRPPSSTLFPHTPLFRSKPCLQHPTVHRRSFLVPRCHRPPTTDRRLGEGERGRPAILHPPSSILRCSPSPFHPFTPSSCQDRKSTRLNSSHANISYAVFC